jgi:site-specific DNA-cytosine methylase
VENNKEGWKGMARVITSKDYNTIQIRKHIIVWFKKEKERTRKGRKTESYQEIIIRLIKFYIQKKKEEREQRENELQREMATRG